MPKIQDTTFVSSPFNKSYGGPTFLNIVLPFRWSNNDVRVFFSNWHDNICMITSKTTYPQVKLSQNENLEHVLLMKFIQKFESIQTT